MIQQRVMACVKRSVPASTAEITPETVLLTSGLVDSLSLVDLITTIEGEFGIRFSSEEMIPNNFDTVAAITEIVSRKAGGPV